jgi:hypothetical protein
MYFLTALDPNFRITGSRDPLGFQSLWATAGHKAVKHLSTVSSNLRDFMILCFGIYFYGDRDPKGFIRFFLKFEQMCAYARRIHNLELSFNGIDYINKKVNDEVFYISLRDTILSNQRTYGIYGKYIRPIRDMRITDDPDFKTIMEIAISKSDRNALNEILNAIFEINDKRVKVNRDDLIPVASLLKTLTNEEREFYKKFILHVPNLDHPQNDLYQALLNNQDIVAVNFQLHQIIQSIIDSKESTEELKFALINISNTDKVLHPLNLVFSHILSKSTWSLDEIEDDHFLNNIPKPVHYDFHDETMRELNNMMGLPANDLVKAIVARNILVSESRGKKGWIEDQKKGFKILYGENGQKITEINAETGYEFAYFLNTYISLFKQIEIA